MPIPQTPTMTLHECADAFRANQISIAEETLCIGIYNNVFPFAVPTKGKNSKCPIIWRKQFYKWLSDNLMQDSVIEI